MGLNAYGISIEWVRVELAECTFNDETLAHNEACVDPCVEVGLAPAVTFTHFTSPHWFAMKNSWLTPRRRRSLRATATR